VRRIVRSGVAKALIVSHVDTDRQSGPFQKQPSFLSPLGCRTGLADLESGAVKQKTPPSLG
jgi:hypothetical protein